MDAQCFTWAGSDVPRIYIIHDEEQYVQPLLHELSRRSLPFGEWNLKSNQFHHLFDAALFDTGRTPPMGIFYNRISACGCGEHRNVPQLARGVLAWLKSHGRRVVNGRLSVPLIVSKLEAQLAMRAHSLTVPHSLAAFDDEQIEKGARSLGGKILVEPNRRELGAGVEAFSSVSELKAHLKSGHFVRSADGITLVQEFVKSKAPFVTRVEFVGRQVLYAMRVDVSRGYDRLIPGYVADPQHEQEKEQDKSYTAVPRYQVLPDYFHDIFEKYASFMSENDLEIASFEFAEATDGRTITFDLDICSTYNTAAEYRAQVPKAGVSAIADYLGRLLELVRPIHGTQLSRKRTVQDSDEEVLSSKKAHRDVLIVDGGTGRELLRRGVEVPPTIWSAQALISAPEQVKEVHLDFIKAGARVITANNYACTPQFLAKGGVEDRMEELIEVACKLACEARDECGIRGVKVIGSLPPLNESYRPDLVYDIQEMLPIYDKIARILARHVDIMLCETMSSAIECQAAAMAASKYGKPIWVSWTLRDDLTARLRSGETVPAAFRKLQRIEIAAFLFNCCVPETIEQALPVLKKLTDKPIGAMPNCFAPVPTDWSLTGAHGFNEIRKDLKPIDFAGYVAGWVDKGVSIVGGCCGIGPEHLSFIADDLNKSRAGPAPVVPLGSAPDVPIKRARCGCGNQRLAGA